MGRAQAIVILFRGRDVIRIPAGEVGRQRDTGGLEVSLDGLLVRGLYERLGIPDLVTRDHPHYQSHPLDIEDALARRRHRLLVLGHQAIELGEQLPVGVLEGCLPQTVARQRMRQRSQSPKRTRRLARQGLRGQLVERLPNRLGNHFVDLQVDR